MDYNITVEVDPESGRKIIVRTYEDGDIMYPDDGDLFVIRNRASVDELLEFANKIRKAGGSNNMLEALIPSTPEESSSCLIANALNFQSKVEGSGRQNEIGMGLWAMYIYDYQVAVNIRDSEELDLEVEIRYLEDNEFSAAIVHLPDKIGYCAAAFDSYHDYELEQFNAANATVSLG